MLVRLFFFLTIILISWTGLAQKQTYLCNLPSGEIIIDGILDDWKDVAWTNDFEDITGQDALRPSLKTRVKMLWDDNYMYFAAEMEEPHLWATVTERDEVIYVDNDFEIFIDPDGDTHNYVEIEVNAMGTIWDLFLTRPYRDGTTPLNSYNIDGLKCQVGLNGTINNASDIDRGWTVEMAVPWEALIDLTKGKRKPYPGEYWRINFSRVQWELDIIDGQYQKAKDANNGKKLPEKNWVWSEQGVVNMHMPEKWGLVFFSGNISAKEVVNPPVPYEESIRDFLRELYFTQKQYHRKYNTYSDRVEEIDTNSRILLSFAGKLEVSATQSQYLITYTSSRDTRWFIDQKGRVWKQKNIKAWVWMHGNNELSDSSWTERFRELASYGVSGILLGGSDELLEKIIPLASQENIEVQAWRWMLNCNNKDVIEDHPEWYSVSREGLSCIEKQPYVGYYKWLCPSREEVREYLSTRVREVLSTEGLSGFHMDYIRHPDVILPVALWDKYGLVQDHEMPEYDYCYCEVCRTKFKDEHGYDPLQLDQPENDIAWRQYRYDMVSECVDDFFEAVNYPQKLSAAVFPSPQIARALVRQDWEQWKLNEVFPMIYHNFYNEDLEWIGETTWAGVSALDDRIPLYSGLYVPSLSPKELSEAIKIAIDAGASGVSLFEYGAMSEEHWEALKTRLDKYW